MNTASSPGIFGFSDLEDRLDGARLEVLALFTTVPETLLALRRAAGLASQFWCWTFCDEERRCKERCEMNLAFWLVAMRAFDQP